MSDFLHTFLRAFTASLLLFLFLDPLSVVMSVHSRFLVDDLLRKDVDLMVMVLRREDLRDFDVVDLEISGWSDVALLFLVKRRGL